MLELTPIDDPLPASCLRFNQCTVLPDLSGEDLAEALVGGLDVLCISDVELSDAERQKIALPLVIKPSHSQTPNCALS